MKNRSLHLVGVFVLLMLAWRSGSANHIVGGRLQMTNVNGEAGRFLVNLTYYYNESQTAHPVTPRQLFVIFRKSDNRIMDTLFITTANVTSRPKVPVTNTGCASGDQYTNWSTVQYEREIRLDPARYGDPAGYYLANQDCCRSNGITNIQYPNTPDRAGFTYYLEFPALTRNGASFPNSSPQFRPLNAEYICINRPFTFSCAATDADGDELRYSLTTPLKGNVTTLGNLTTNGLIPGPFSLTQFTAGNTSTSPIPGNPGVQLNSSTGQFSVTATQLGLFIFTVKVEEYRNGQKIGEVRQDYQFAVVDCPPDKPPVPTATIVNAPTSTTEATLCGTGSVTLQAQSNPAWKYQWQKDGVNIVGATSPTLSVTATGAYAVVNSFTSNCGQTNTSRTLTVRSFSQSVKLDRPAKTSLCPGSDAFVLKGPDLQATYTWYWNNTAISGLNQNTQVVSQPGQYYAKVKDNRTGCETQTDTITLTMASSPTVTIGAVNPANVICERDSLRLTALGATTYQWFLNGTEIVGQTGAAYVARQPGSYRVTGTDANGCRGNSALLTITVQPRVKPTLDAIPAACGTTGPVVNLRGSPAGGVFSGPGISGSSFSPATAGIGVHRIVYTAPAVNGCPGDTAQRFARVNQLPTVQLPERIVTTKQGIVELRPEVDGSGPFTYQWQPTVWLSSPTQASVTVTFPQSDTTYTVRVRDVNGCEREASVRILIQSKISIPDAFSPNNDQMNDTWRLFGIESFPQAQVTVFSRWGEVVYHSRNGYLTPFDGQYLGEPLPVGMYLYVLKLSPETEPLRGSVLLAR